MVVNHSSKPLNSAESALLSKGLHFCRNAPKINVRELDEERSTLRDLQERDDIIIKPADKGSAVVVMDKTAYIQEAERQLSDCRF